MFSNTFAFLVDCKCCYTEKHLSTKIAIYMTARYEDESVGNVLLCVI